MKKPNCPRCKCETFKKSMLSFEDDTTQVEAVVCGGCGAVISTLAPLDHPQAWAVLEKLGIIP